MILNESAHSKPARYIVFAPESGVLSEHKTLAEAIAALQATVKSAGPFSVPPAIYRQKDFDWERIRYPLSESYSLAS